MTILFFLLLLFSASQASALTLNGAGPEPAGALISAWVAGYTPALAPAPDKKKTAASPSLQINYQGMRGMEESNLLKAHAVDFAVAAMPMGDEDLKKLNGVIYHIPVAAKGIAVAYHFPNGKGAINLSGEVLANIYMGAYKKWNHPLIKKINKGAELPNEFIMPAYRTDANATQYNLTHFIADSDKAWAKNMSFGPTLAFKAGKGVDGYQAMADYVKNTPYALGFVDYGTAVATNLTMAAIQHTDAGAAVALSPDTMGKAMEKGQENFPSDNRVSLTHIKQEGAYPLTAYVYFLIYQTQADPQKAKALVDFIRYALGEGQSSLAGLHYVPLPAAVKEKALATLNQVYLPLP